LQEPLLREQLHHLHKEKWVALGLLVDARYKLARGHRVERAGEVRRDFSLGQSVQRDAQEARLTVQLRQRLRKRVGACELGVSVRRDDEHPHVG
jgi:hypothetical protein